ncbi:SAM-dependent methyltransferase [Sphaerisporangium rufum]|uniref:SAM-dependent methyltransferase n=1 Tax=Sphaerisporangium rufum TaxID=1381558 RepID=A0A919V2E7_9ACTN|nr:N-6 DNA methylase [Sphaerisporangium rufum]GII75225.1 SAM-dependent methyltransferase [Sphaerisporangium rufum]
MGQDATLNAGDIARLADVGRAAVSNWRRRYDDFPQPVGGTAASPLFSLPEIEDWLRRNGKSYEMSLGDRAWQALKTAGDDLRLGELVGCAGAFLLYLAREPAAARRAARAADPAAVLRRDAARATADLPVRPDWSLVGAGRYALLADLAAEQGPAAAFELLCERYAEAHSRQLSVTRPDIVALLAGLARLEGQGGTVLDPACGVGALLLPLAGARLLGQESGEAAALVAAARLLLGGARAEIAAGDSLRADGFPGRRADIVLCDPPFNERAWGYEELTGDPRWEYGLPPRGEPELAWVQHCLAHVRPGGLVAILMPSAAAGRRPGKRIRGNLLRAGALRAVVALGPGGPDLWLLRRPEPGARQPSTMLVAEAGDEPSGVLDAWRAFGAAPEAEPPGGRAVRIIDLLDDEIDLTPARYRPRHPKEDPARAYAAARERFQAAAAALGGSPPRLAARAGDLPTTTVGELVRAGLVGFHQGPARPAAGHGDLPMLTVADVVAGGPPSGRTRHDPGQVVLEPGDVVATASATECAARTVTEGGAVLGPQLHLYRVDPERLDPDFLAGHLRYAGTAGTGRAHPGASRVDARRVRIPRLPLAEQRAHGRAFRELLELDDRLRETSALGRKLVGLGFDGLAGGHLRPDG